MDEQIKKLIESYEVRRQTCLAMVKESAKIPDPFQREAKEVYFLALARLWKTVINDLERLDR